MHWKITALVCAMFSYIGFAQAADSFTIHVAGDTRQCEIPRPSVCRNHTNAMWMYFDEKGQIFVYDDVDSGVMLKPGKRSGSYLHKDYPAHTQVSYSKNGEVYKFNMKITMKRKGIYYNKSMNWSYTFRINGNPLSD